MGKVYRYKNPDTLIKAVCHGNLAVKASMLIMGTGQFVYKQIFKGCLFLGIQIAYILFMIEKGSYYLHMLSTLGEKEQQEVWNESKGVFEYQQGDNSVLLLLYGVVVLFLTVMFVLCWRASIIQAYQLQKRKTQGKHINNILEDIKNLFDKNLHKTFMALPLTGIVVFTILPLVFMISMAFTNYSKTGDHTVLFDWIGMENFRKVLNLSDSIGETFWPVLGWTLIWAVSATFTSFIFGMLIAILINRKQTHFKRLWRFCFVMSIAIPQFVSLLIVRTMLDDNGIVNMLLKEAGLITTSLPFWTSGTWARVTVIIVNLWVGVPYTMIQVTGILNNIPDDLYDAARIDGASRFQTFIKITMPYMIFIMAPYLITQFTGNVNNFNVIYLLSGGNPASGASTAGKTDLMVTWLYKLTIDKQYYNLGAVIGIITFIVLAIIALFTYHRTKSYKDEGGFQV